MTRKNKILIGISVFFVSILLLGIIFNDLLPFNFDYSTYNNGYELENAFPNLDFENLVHLENDGTDTLYAVEQQGVIKKFQNLRDVSSFEIFLDIESNVRSGGETGLLGLTFDPNFSSNGYFYIDYTIDNSLRTIISRFEVVNGAVDYNSELTILEVDQPYSNHNGGTLSFGLDGMLYISLGDGGSRADPQGNGQDLSTLLGSILRINVTSSSVDQPYTIPVDNPFVSQTNTKGEIWAYGLRNPWKFSFDRQTGNLWAGDVGQESWEEVNLIVKGNNYGWDRKEGFECFEPSDGCDSNELVDPVIAYDRDEGKSIVGGYVYRGSAIPDLNGKYVYADYISGRVWHLNAEDPDNPQVFDMMKYLKNFSGFGIDNNNELFLLEYDGIIHRIIEE